MLNPLNIAVSTTLVALAGAAAAQGPVQMPRHTCDLMSREEMQLCLSTKEGDASGARSARCDQIARTQIEACLRHPSPEVTASAPRDRDTAPGDTASNSAEQGERRRQSEEDRPDSRDDAAGGNGFAGAKRVPSPHRPAR